MSQDMDAKEGGIVHRLDAGRAIAEHESGRAKTCGHLPMTTSVSFVFGAGNYREASLSKNTSV